MLVLGTFEGRAGAAGEGEMVTVGVREDPLCAPLVGVMGEPEGELFSSGPPVSVSAKGRLVSRGALLVVDSESDRFWELREGCELLWAVLWELDPLDDRLCGVSGISLLEPKLVEWALTRVCVVLPGSSAITSYSVLCTPTAKTTTKPV